MAGEVGLADLNARETGVSMGAVWGDYDNDGYDDVFLYKWGKPELYHNEGGKRFISVSHQAGLPNWVNANSAVWFDYDRDGNLDLFLGGYYPENVNLWHLKTTRIMPESFEYAGNGGRKYLFHNLGGGKFEEVAKTGDPVPALGPGRSRGGSCGAPVIPICSSPMTMAFPSCTSMRTARAFVRSENRPESASAEKRDDSVGRRRSQPRSLWHLRQ